MNLTHTMSAGFLGAVVLVLLFLGSPTLFGMPMIDITGLIGSVIAIHPWRARLIGGLVLLLEGAVVAAVSGLLWNAGIGSGTLPSGLLFGGVAGTVTLVGIAILFRQHPRWPQNQHLSQDMIGMCWWFSHLLSGLLVAIIYAPLA